MQVSSIQAKSIFAFFMLQCYLLLTLFRHQYLTCLNFGLTHRLRSQRKQVAVTKKIALLMVIALVTAAVYFLEPLKLDAILMFLATGIVFLICRYCKIHFTAQHPTGWLARLLTWIPLALLLAIIFMQIQHGEILLSGAQGIGFTALAICLFSPLALLHQHHASDTQ